MPHVVDIVTNLNKAAVHRMFTAINAEIRHHQGLNADTGTKDIVDYRQRGLHLTGPAYPHLFIIIDEYAEMINDNPEYRAELESIAHVGRAQGVNLLLASQRPKGVTDQMHANIKLRLCLRVEQIDTSREMLRRPDAALLPNGLPGRGYLPSATTRWSCFRCHGQARRSPTTASRRCSGHNTKPPRRWRLRSRPSSTTRSQACRWSCRAGRWRPSRGPPSCPPASACRLAVRDAQRNRTFTLTTAVSDWLNSDVNSLWPGVTWRGGEEVGLPAAMQPVAGLVDDPAKRRARCRWSST